MAAIPWGRLDEGDAAVFEYGGSVASAILRYKYAGRSDLGPRLGEVMAAAAMEMTSRVEVVVPVPLHPRRIVERGFDQAALLARPVARQLRVPWGVSVLARVRETPKQAALDRAARLSNLASAIVVARPEAVEGRTVLLVDDVRTTGATLAACREVLAKAGAREVRGLTLARQGADRSEKPQLP